MNRAFAIAARFLSQLRDLAFFRSVKASRKPEPATCSITELGFVRILSQLPEFDISVANAKDARSRRAGHSHSRSIVLVSDLAGRLLRVNLAGHTME